MASLIDELVTLLREQASDFSDLADLADEKKEAIVKNDIEHLQKITNLENTLVGQNLKSERRRAQLMKDVAMVINSDPKTLTVSSLTRALEGKPGHDELAGAGEALRKAAGKLKTLNEQNGKLIESSLEYIDFSMNLMRSSQVQPSFYTPGGEEMPGASTFFDARQ